MSVLDASTGENNFPLALMEMEMFPHQGLIKVKDFPIKIE